MSEPGQIAAAVPEKRFGAFGGVFTPSILTILGVIMFLRFGTIVGNAGLVGALIIVALAHVISLATGLSVASISTNRTVGVGGAYFMISRSLGAATGAAIGIPLYLAQALSVSFYIVGFVESLRYVWPALPAEFTGTLTLGLLVILSMRSAGLAIKAQYVVMTAIGLSLVSFFLGRGDAPPNEVLLFNPNGASFDEMFALFFPAVTGIMAGVSMSGDLKDPRRALPRGTLWAIMVGWAVYTVVPIWLATNASTTDLMDHENIVWQIAYLPFLIYVGVWGATLSSALGSVLAAPRTLQALAIDRIVPRLFGRGRGPANEPVNGLILTWILAQAGIFAGSLDAIAEVLTMFFLATYGLTNLVCGLERWAASPSFRPTFKVPAALSLIGAAACFFVMSRINFGAMMAAAAICGLIYVYAKRRALDTTYGDARHGMWSALVRSALHRLRRAEYHSMNWRPNLIILGGDLDKRPHLLELGSAMVQHRGIVTYFQLIPGRIAEQAEKRRGLIETLERRMADHPNVFVRVDIVRDLHRAVVTSAQSYGVGPIEANAVMLGWTGKPERAEAYLEMLRDLNGLDRSLLLVRYDPKRRLGRGENIHIWWGGRFGNGAMMLLLGFLLRSDDFWRRATVTVLTVVDDEAQVLEAETGLLRVFESARIESRARVILRGGRTTAQVMREESGEADLAMIGFRLPAQGSPPERFFERMSPLLEALPTTILVNSGRHFEGAPVLFDDRSQ